MPTTYKNRLRCAVSAVASAGLGAWTVSTAASGAVTFAAGDDGKTFTVLGVEGTAWEVRTGCVYTHSGTSLSRGTLEASSTGGAITFTTACVLDVTPSAAELTRFARAAQAITPGGRLTLTSGTPVTTSDVTGATTIYYTPYVSDIISLWDGAEWTPITFIEITHAMGTVTSGANYDVFGYLNSGALAIEKLIWTNDSTRATAITLQDGRYCKSGDKTRLYLGTIRSTSTTATEDSAGGTTTQVGGKRFVWNMYNRVRKHALVKDTTSAWVYKTATWRQANAASGNKVEFVIGLASNVSATYTAGVAVQGSIDRAAAGVGIDSTTAPTGFTQPGYNGVTGSYCISALNGAYDAAAAAGYHYLAALEKGATGSDCQFTGNDATSGQCGLYAWLMG